LERMIGRELVANLNSPFRHLSNVLKDGCVTGRVLKMLLVD